MAYITFKILLGFIYADYLHFCFYFVKNLGLKLSCFDFAATYPSQ